MESPAIAYIPVAGLSAEQLVARIRLEHRSFVQAREIAVSAARTTVEKAIVLGELFEEACRRYPGNFEEWLEANFADISRTSAWRYRHCYSQRASLLAEEPETLKLKEAYVKLGLLPPPNEDDAPTRSAPKLYCFRLVVNGNIESWEQSDLQEFLNHTAKVAELREAAARRLAQIAA